MNGRVYGIQRDKLIALRLDFYIWKLVIESELDIEVLYLNSKRWSAQRTVHEGESGATHSHTLAHTLRVSPALAA